MCDKSEQKVKKYLKEAKGYQKGDEVKKLAKPDFPKDKDGNKEGASMKKALADKKTKGLTKEELEGYASSVMRD